MPTTQQLRSRLTNKLKELFQLDQPDLDFGFYRIMHAKAEQVNAFIENDLLKIVEDAFGHLEGQNNQELLAQAKQKVIDVLGEDAFDAQGNLIDTYKNSRVGRSYLEELAKIEQNKQALSAEADIYDHLYRFFERYYDNGDFISRRYYTRETAGKAAPFAVPYHGEEVKLHWANADQYYIKTAEYFANFTLDLRQATEVQATRVPMGFDALDTPRKVHFRIVDASEGEHGNVKASDATKRFFLIYAAKPVELNDAGELVINFEYRADAEKSGQDNTWRDKRNAEAVETVLTQLRTMAKNDKHIAEYLRLLETTAPIESDKKRPLLAKYINQYTARNTMDYFIHKDLGSFLHRELDFYIKNEVMRLDDIENANPPSVESYLAKIKVLRKIAGKLIDFLAMLEEFQKKLWLKKKFVVETNYCITLDRVPEALYPEIAANQAQHDEWVKLFAIDEIQESTVTVGYSEPLTIEFLKANNKLVLDTQCFNDAFKAKLTAAIENFDEQCDGVLIHSENFQALNLLLDRFRTQLKAIYIDPPYNTNSSEITYKNGYKSSSWNSLINNGLPFAIKLLKQNGILCATIDDEQQKELASIISENFGHDNILGTVCVRINPSGRITLRGFAQSHEYAIFAGKSKSASIAKLPRSDVQSQRFNREDARGSFEQRNFRREGSSSERYSRPKRFFPIYVAGIKIRIPQLEWQETTRSYNILEAPLIGESVVYPIDNNGTERVWRWGIERIRREIDEIYPKVNPQGELQIYYKYRPNEEGVLPTTVWIDKKYSATEYGTATLKDLFRSRNEFSFPKSIHAVEDCLTISVADDDTAIILDYFAGSGTTGHAVINLNRRTENEYKYILVEMGNYFDTVLKPRITKAIYSQDWKDGKPITRDRGISHCFKYLRLESYEDALNNLRFAENPTRQQAIAANALLKEDYMLHYLLDVETRRSQSLLNIDAFADPTAYTLQVKKSDSDESVVTNVDLLETFNYLLGLRVTHIAAPQTFTTEFERLPDPELPHDQQTKLVVKGRIRQDEQGPWWFRKVEGWVPSDPANPNNGQRQKVLIVWRKLTGDLEQDNLMLDEWFKRNRISTLDFEFQTIYVNGSNNLPNLALDSDIWKVRLIEEEFMKRMWDVE